MLTLRDEIGIPHTLKGLKVDDTKAKLIAEMAIVDPTASGNPVALDVRLANTRITYPDSRARIN